MIGGERWATLGVAQVLKDNGRHSGLRVNIVDWTKQRVIIVGPIISHIVVFLLFSAAFQNPTTARFLPQFSTMISSRPLLLDCAALTKLKRPMLQQVAIVCCVTLVMIFRNLWFHQKEHIKANAKSAEIIRLLLQKHPDGVPGYTSSTNLCDFAEASNSTEDRRRNTRPELRST
jgi:hypothetical protein